MSVIVARRQAVANVVVGVAAAMQIGLVPLLVIGASRNVDLAIDSNSVGGIVLAVAYTLVGWIIIRRQPQNPLGWVFLGVGFFESLSVFTAAYAADAYAIGQMESHLVLFPELTRSIEASLTGPKRSHLEPLPHV